MKLSTLGTLLLGAAVGGGAAGGVINALANRDDYQLQGYSITWNSGQGPNYPLNKGDKITCYVDKVTPALDPEGKTVLMLEGGPQEFSNDSKHLPLAKGPECYFGDHTPASDITKGQYADTKAVSGVEGTDFKPFHGIQEGAIMYPFAIDASRVVEISASSPDMLGNLNSRK